MSQAMTQTPVTKTPPLRRSALSLKLLATAALLAGCTVGPDYHRPTAPLAAHFKEADGWRSSQPADAIDKGAWWSMFNHPVLDGLERRVAVSNQTVAQYFYAYRNAHQLVAEARSQFFPTLSASGSANYAKGGGGAGIANTATGSVLGGSTTGTTGVGTNGTGTTGTCKTGTANGTGASTGTTSATGGAATSNNGTTLVTGGNSPVASFEAGLEAAWVPDLWGRVRRTVESNVASAQASAADIANEQLIVQSELASDYFELRVLDEEARLYRDTVAAYQRSLQLTVNQYNVGVAARSDVVTAQTQVLTAQASLIDLGSTRGQMEHAIAMLAGTTPDQLSITPAPLSRAVPVAPTGIASTLLERRPDIAGAERRVQAANALIGVEEAAFYPDLTLSASYGYGATNLGSLFNSSSSLWSLGSSLADTLIDAGGRRAAVRAQRALADEQTAIYRQTVLTAFQNVEDELVALRVLQQEETVRVQAEEAARIEERLALNEYRAGTVPYTTVIVDEAQALAASQSVLTVLQARLQASVGLVEALGGGWTTADLPKS